MMNCLYCYKKLDNGLVDFHPACSRKIFGKPEPPLLPYTEDQMPELYAHDVYDKNNNCTTTFSYLGLKMTAMDLGNLHYGIVGKAAGFSEMQLKVAAGLAQIKDGTSRDEWQTPYMLERYFGDDPNDQKWIGVGFRLYNKYFYSPGFKLPNWMSWLYRF